MSRGLGRGMARQKTDIKVFLGSWRVIVACALTMWLAYGMRMCTISLLTGTITEDLMISRGLFSFTTTFRYMTGFVINLLFGKILRRFGTRNVLITGFLFTSLGELLYSFSSVLPMFYLAGAISGMGVGFASAPIVALIVGDHFTVGKGTILGLTSAFSGLGAAIFNPVVGVVTDRLNWRAGFYLSTAISAVVGMCVILLINAHEKRMRRPGAVSEAENKAIESERAGMTIAEAKRALQYVALLAVGVLLGIATNSGYTNFPAHLGDAGFDFLFVSSVAAVVLSVFNSLGKIIFGALNDRLGVGRAAMIPLVMTMLGGIFAILAAPSAAYLAVFAAVGLGFGICTNTIIPSLWVTGIFGQKESASIMGYVSAMIMLGSAVGMPLSNLLFDASGSYMVSYIINVVLMGIVILLNVTQLGTKKALKYI